MIIVANSVFCQTNTSFKQLLLTDKTFFFTTGTAFQLQKPCIIIPADFSCTQLGFFCKKELKVESVTKIPFRFRLGSLQYNDWMEGKKNTGILPVN